MDKVKQSIKEFTSRAGHNDTTVHETVAPGVKHETVKPVEHEEVNTAVDREVHQDHYHRTVQPVQDREVLPEKHTANIGATQHREFDHRDQEATREVLSEEQQRFRDEVKVEPTTHTQSTAPSVGGEHVHHHVHETIQPVVEREVVQPEVVHTTIPVHETHHNASKYHKTTELPPVSMDEFKHKGGVLSGREERYDGFEGEPKNIGGAMSGLKSTTGKRDSHHGDFDSSNKTAAGRMDTPLSDSSRSSTGAHDQHAGITGTRDEHTGMTGTAGTHRDMDRMAADERARTGTRA